MNGRTKRKVVLSENTFGDNFRRTFKFCARNPALTATGIQAKTSSTECEIPSIFNSSKQNKAMSRATIKRIPIPVKKVVRVVIVVRPNFSVCTFIICAPKIARTTGEYASAIIDTPLSIPLVKLYVGCEIVERTKQHK